MISPQGVSPGVQEMSVSGVYAHGTSLQYITTLIRVLFTELNRVKDVESIVSELDQHLAP